MPESVRSLPESDCMNLKESRELLDLLEAYPDVDIRISLDKTDLMNVLKAAKFHVVLESNAWRNIELSIPVKALERNHV